MIFRNFSFLERIHHGFQQETVFSQAVIDFKDEGLAAFIFHIIVMASAMVVAEFFIGATQQR